MSVLFRLLVPAMLLLALAACGNDDGNGADDTLPTNGDDSGGVPGPEDSDGDDGDDDTGAAQPPAGSGDGTLSVAGVTFAFDVIFCGFDSSETGNEDVPFSMRGRGTTADGDRFEVDAVIVELDNTEVHSVSLWIGDSFPYDLTYESERMDLQGTVMGTGETSEMEIGLDWPFLEIDGKQVRAEGGFFRYEDLDEENAELVGMGTLEATCP